MKQQEFDRRFSASAFEDIRKSLEPSLRVHQLLGIAPLHIIGPGKRVTNSRWSIVRRVQLLFSLLIIVLAMSGYLYKFVFRFQVKNLPFFNNLLYNLELLLEITNTPLAILACQRKRHMYEHVLQRFAVLHQDGRRSELRWMQTWFHRLFLVAAGTFLVMLVVDISAWKSPVMSLASFWSVHIPTMISALAVSQYWYAIMFILRHRRQLNRVLESYSSGLRGTCRLDVLEDLRRQHSELHELVLYVNDGYGKLLLNTTVTVVVVVNVELLELYQYIRHGITTSSIFWFVMYAVIWFFLHLGLLFMIVYPCHWTEYERRRTGLVLFDLLGKGPHSEREIEAMMHFSQQILNQKEKYKACGIVPLNLSLISTLVGALSTYLVILIQFASS